MCLARGITAVATPVCVGSILASPVGLVATPAARTPSVVFGRVREEN